MQSSTLNMKNYCTIVSVVKYREIFQVYNNKSHCSSNNFESSWWLRTRAHRFVLFVSANTCPPVPSYSNAYTNGKDALNGTVHTVTCNTGYKLQNGMSSFNISCDGIRWSVDGSPKSCNGNVIFVSHVLCKWIGAHENVLHPCIHVSTCTMHYAKHPWLLWAICLIHLLI